MADNLTPRMHFTLDPNGTRYTVETGVAVGYLTECAWRPSKNGEAAHLFFLAAVFGTKQQAEAIRASLVTGGQVNLFLPAEHYATREKPLGPGVNYYNRYESYLQEVKKGYSARLVKSPYRGHITSLGTKEQHCYQLVYYPETALRHSQENETALLLRSDDPDQWSTIYHYLNERLYFPILPEWTKTLWDYCVREHMAEQVFSLGMREQPSIVCWSMALRPRPMREYLSDLLQQGLLPLPDIEPGAQKAVSMP